MHVNQEGIDLIKQFEGCRLIAYRLKGEKYNSIAYGHFGPDVKDGMKITQAQAEAYLKKDLEKFEKYVEDNVKNIPLTQHRFNSLVSYCYNRGLGVANSSKQSGLMQLIVNSNTVEEYSNNIVKYWGTATRYKEALIARRKKEKAHFDLDRDTIGELKEQPATPKQDKIPLYRVTATALNYRQGPGINYPIVGVIKKNEVYGITKIENNFGLLKSGAGYVSMNYMQKI